MNPKKLKSVCEMYKLAAKEEERVRTLMATLAPELLQELAAETSLRAVGRMIGRSACYLSFVMNGKVEASPETFKLLAELRLRTSK